MSRRIPEDRVTPIQGINGGSAIAARVSAGEQIVAATDGKAMRGAFGCGAGSDGRVAHDHTGVMECLGAAGQAAHRRHHHAVGISAEE